MKKGRSITGQLDTLRRQAEEFLDKTPEAIKDIPPGDVQNLIEELHIHQIELEMQNEELRRAQLELEAARDRYSDLYDFAPVGYFTISETGMIVEANLTGTTMLGMERGLLIGNPVSKFINRDDQDIFYHHRRKLVETKNKQTCELRLVKKDGSQFHAQMESVALLDENGNLDQVRAAITDITERKRTEEALQDSKQRLDSIMRAVPDIIYRLDSDGNIVFISDAVRKYAYSPEELLNTNILQWIHPDDRKGVTYRINERRTKERAAQLFEVRLFPERPVDALFEGDSRDTQDELVFLVTAEGLYRSDVPRTETFIGTQGIARDVTERRRLEAQLRQTAKMEAIAILAGGIAHEFNNALVGVSGNIELLQMDLPNGENIDKYIERTKTSTRRMVNLTNQLLAYARGGKYQPKIMSLNDIVKNTVPLIQHSIGPAIRVEMDLPDGISNVEADLTQMQMVLFAVLSNASEAVEGEGRIRLITRDEEIDEKIAEADPHLEPGSYVSLTIEDDGKGMDQETINGVFDPFFTTKFQGRGMGMAAAHGIIKNHGGSILVDSELGKGTAVRIYLPAVEVRVEQAKKAKIEMSATTGTILVIEDEDVVIDVIGPMLERLGYRMLVAKTGKDAVDIAKGYDGDIDLAILDIVLPDMRGEHVYPLIMKARPNLKVIVCSGYSIEGPAQKILDAGAQAFIQKPFSLETLSKKLKGVFGGQIHH